MINLKKIFVTAIVSAVAITMSAQSADTVKKDRIIDSATGKATEVALPYKPVDDVVGPYYIEREKAIEIAMSQFGNSASCDYYASWSGSKLITDPKVCYADDIPDGGGWVRSGYHWLIFVDEAPTKSWEHECSYVYVECEVPSIKVAPKCCVIRGKKPTYDVCGFEARSAVNRYGAKANLKPSVAASESTYNSAVGGRTYALIMDCASDVLDNFERCWNDCSFIYQTLHKKYNVPKDNISVIIGTDEYDTFMRKADGSGFTNNSHDFDLDGVAEMTSPLASEDLDYELLYRIKKNITKQDQLLIFITGNGGYDTESGRYYAQMRDNNRLYADELALKLDEIEARSVCIVLGQSFAGGFAKELEGKGRVICAGCGTSEAAVSCRYIPYTEFLYRWTSAMNQADAEGNYVASDHNGNGMVTVEEAFKYAKERMSNTTPTMSSTPLYIQEDMALNYIPKDVDLYIRDVEEDTGTVPSTLGSIWDSPDIWVRMQKDGYTNQYSEPIKVSSDENTVYIYVRITNRGQEDYNGHGQFLHINWTDASMSMTKANWWGKYVGTKTSPGGTKWPKEIEDSIKAGESIIYFYKFQFDDGSFSGIKPDEKITKHTCLLVHVNDISSDDYDSIPTYPDERVKVAWLNYVAQRNLTVTYFKETKSVDIPIYIRNLANEKRAYDIEVVPDSKSGSANVFSDLEVCVNVTPAVYRAWNSGGKSAKSIKWNESSPYRIQLTDIDSQIKNIVLAPEHEDKLVFTVSQIANMNSYIPQHYKFHIIQRDSETGEILGGEAFEFVTEGREAVLEPAISAELTDGRYELTETNVTEDSEYEWTDADNKVIAKGKTVRIDAPVVDSSYKLRVQSRADGAVNYAAINLAKVPIIESISPNPFTDNLNIKLSRCADENTSVLVSGISDNSIKKEINLSKGDKGLSIDTSMLPKGGYIITIICNEKVMESRQVVK